MEPTGHRRAHILFAALAGFYLASLALSPAIDAFTAGFVSMRSEYRVVEQLSKFCLLAIILVTFIAFAHEEARDRRRLNALYLALALTLYLAESNMIKPKMQPVLVGLLILPILVGLARARAGLAFSILIPGLVAIGMGALSDSISEAGSAAELAPGFLLDLTGRIHEETWDVLGLGLLTLSILVLERDAIERSMRDNVPGTLLVFLGAVLIAVGNGLSHRQYMPGPTLWTVGLSFACLGCAIVVLTNRFLLRSHGRVIPEHGFWHHLFGAGMFVALPSSGVRTGHLGGLLLWALTILFAYRLMVRNHRTCPGQSPHSIGQ